MGTSATALHNGVVITEDGVLTGHDVVVEGRLITGVVPSDSVSGRVARVDVGGGFIAPGLIDVHTHGAVGRSFAERDTEAYDAILRFLASNGITRAQASLPSAPFGDLESQLEWVRSYERPADGAVLHGVHLEGPYLSAEDQARGAANPAHLRTPQPGDADRLLAYADVLRMVTIAPELPGAVAMIRALAAGGVVVAVGHSSAEREDFASAVEAGATHITHLWSGMANVLRRSQGERVPGMIELALASDALTGEVIADAKHLPPELLTIARRCLGGSQARLCVVSDSSIGTGMPDGYRYGPPDRPIEVSGGVAHLVGQGRFAGSTSSMNRMARVLLRLGWPVHEVVSVMSAVPAKVLGLAERKGAVRAGYDADLAVFDQRFNCTRTMIEGSWVHSPEMASSQIGPPNADVALIHNTGELK
ncbi:N-acetylglucosamine-6-phosphate deacetylase [Sinomonas sp. P47F7]|uniref:N-acetylglucosamine-6-phosphate deacetylase n=1 Tax=Sinomonas sp. P47F7 TaxID=3410987 RepID=UPI003BF52AAE